jgi:BirA family biotin operon repressor/biotin-[acetyl-CoA-carboxylase] ligase
MSTPSGGTPSTFDAAAVAAALSADARAHFATIEAVDTIDSTNSELLRRRTPSRGIVALFADRQSGGRGRLGRVWSSPPGGNLYLSLARCFDGELARLGGLSLAVGVAVAEALHALGADAVRLKWPNDVVIDAGDADDALRKLGGVLIEGGLQDGRARTVIGIGLNLRMPAAVAAADAPAIDQPWTDLQALLGPALPARENVAANLLAALAAALARFDVEGLAPFLPRFAALDVLQGRELVADLDGRTLTGVGDGLDADGTLRLRTDTGTVALRAGEVRVRRRARERRDRA